MSCEGRREQSPEKVAGLNGYHCIKSIAGQSELIANREEQADNHRCIVRKVIQSTSLRAKLFAHSIGSLIKAQIYLRQSGTKSILKVDWFSQHFLRSWSRSMSLFHVAVGTQLFLLISDGWNIGATREGSKDLRS
jgi:hypothetical protein